MIAHGRLFQTTFGQNTKLLSQRDIHTDKLQSVTGFSPEALQPDENLSYNLVFENLAENQKLF